MKKRARDLSITPGILSPGPLNAITDVHPVRVGHLTLVQDDDIRTGATVILPHPDNIFQSKVPAGLAVANGFGKLMGGTQIRELGEIETPIVLTNTLCVPRAAEGILDWLLSQPGNERVVSVNPVVGETNDSRLNNIRRRMVTADMIRCTIDDAAPGPVDEGSVGAGTGTMAFGWKGGIGTSSRLLPECLGGHTVGVLVQSNFGGVLQVLGQPVGQLLGRYYLRSQVDTGDADGSIMIILATDAPLSDRNLTRLARRSLAGLARTGASFANGSGDYAVAFSVNGDVRRHPGRPPTPGWVADVPNDQLSPLFQASIEAAEEAILNSLFMATTVTGYKDFVGEALPVDQVIKKFLPNRGHGRL